MAKRRAIAGSCDFLGTHACFHNPYLASRSYSPSDRGAHFVSTKGEDELLDEQDAIGLRLGCDGPEDSRKMVGHSVEYSSLFEGHVLVVGTPTPDGYNMGPARRRLGGRSAHEATAIKAMNSGIVISSTRWPAA